MNYKKIKTSMDSILRFMEDSKSQFVEDPISDFTRARKLSFSETIKCLLSMDNHSLNTELRNYFSLKTDFSVTKSAFVQRREKLSDHVFRYIFDSLIKTFPFKKLYCGYHLLAVDGSDINIPSLPGSDETYVKSCVENVGFHQMHLNSLYDLMEGRYYDYEIQPRACLNEHSAFCEMIDRNMLGAKTLYIADCGYQSLNSIEHILRAGQSFVIRAKDAYSYGSPFKHMCLPNTDEFDLDIEFKITRSRKQQYQNDPIYKTLKTHQTFDAIPISDRETIVPVEFRLVKLRISEDTVEYLLTNLPRKKFKIQELKEVYNARWGIETSFRLLKYNFALNSFHSIKRKFICQEIESHLIMYNLTMLLVASTPVPQKATKHKYKISIADAVVTAKLFFRGCIKALDVARELLKYLTPIRKGLSAPRKVRKRSVVPLNNRS